MIDKIEIKQLSPREQKGREIDSLSSERSLLLDLDLVLNSRIKKEKNTKWKDESLVENVKSKYFWWQGLYSDQPGLDSGTHGEAFARLEAVKILECSPETIRIVPLLANDKDQLSFFDYPKNASEKAKFEIELYVWVGSSYRKILFKFDCSLNDVKRRLEEVEKQWEIKREDYHELSQKEESENS